MAKIKLSEGGFTLIPEGVTTFKIVGAKYDEDFGKLEIEMQTKSGLKHTEKYSLLNKDGEVNQKAVNAFSYMAKAALNNFNLDVIDHEDIIGCYVTATVTHNEYERRDGKGLGKSVNLWDFIPAAGFGTGESKLKEKAVEDEDDEDLDDFLDD